MKTKVIENQKPRSLLKTQPADMPEDINKKPPVTNNCEPGSSKKVIQNRHKEISHGCECGSTSCENCPVAFEMKMGPERDVGYRNVFSYLKVVAVILIATFIIKESFTLLPV